MPTSWLQFFKIKKKKEQSQRLSLLSELLQLHQNAPPLCTKPCNTAGICMYVLCWCLTSALRKHGIGCPSRLDLITLYSQYCQDGAAGIEQVHTGSYAVYDSDHAAQKLQIQKARSSYGVIRISLFLPYKSPDSKSWPGARHQKMYIEKRLSYENHGLDSDPSIFQKKDAGGRLNFTVRVVNDYQERETSYTHPIWPGLQKTCAWATVETDATTKRAATRALGRDCKRSII